MVGEHSKAVIGLIFAFRMLLFIFCSELRLHVSCHAFYHSTPAKMSPFFIEAVFSPLIHTIMKRRFQLPGPFLSHGRERHTFSRAMMIIDDDCIMCKLYYITLPSQFI